jgi:transposase-like protein
MDNISYCRHRFPGIVIQQAVWLYFRFALSYRDVEDMLAERGIDVTYETVRRWVLKFGSIIARKLRRGRPRPDGRWHLDEVFVSINGRQLYIWRAVDSEGEVLDILVQPRRDHKATLKLMRKLLKKQGVAPAAVVTDKLRSYGSALRELGVARRQETGRWKNNRAENSHQPLRQRGTTYEALQVTFTTSASRPASTSPRDLEGEPAVGENLRHHRAASTVREGRPARGTSETPR